MAKYHKFQIKTGEIDLNDKKWTKRQAEDLEKTLTRLAMEVPSLVTMVGDAPYGDKIYNLQLGASSTARLTYPCGHYYQAAPAVWFQPKCEVCGKAMEKNVKVDPGTWRSAPINPPKPSVLDKLTGGK